MSLQKFWGNGVYVVSYQYMYYLTSALITLQQASENLPCSSEQNSYSVYINFLTIIIKMTAHDIWLLPVITITSLAFYHDIWLVGILDSSFESSNNKVLKMVPHKCAYDTMFSYTYSDWFNKW